MMLSLFQLSQQITTKKNLYQLLIKQPSKQIRYEFMKALRK